MADEQSSDTRVCCADVWVGVHPESGAATVARQR